MFLPGSWSASASVACLALTRRPAGVLLQVRNLVSDVPDVNGTVDRQGLRALHFAAAKGHQLVLEFLSTKGADLDGEDARGRSPLHYAALGGHTDCCAFLAKRGCWLDASDGADDTPLHLAARSGHAPTAQALAEVGAKLELRNKRGLTPLGEAVASGHAETAQALLEAGACPGAASAHGLSLLHIAAGMGHVDCVRLLVEQCGADVHDASNEEGATPLHAAALSGSAECAGALLELGAKATAKNSRGELPMDYVQTPDYATATVADLPPQLVLRQVLADAGGNSKKAYLMAGPKDHPGHGYNQKAPAQQAPKEEPYSELLRKVDALSKQSEQQLTEKQLGAQAMKCLGDVQQAARLLECFRAICSLRADEDFQVRCLPA